MTAAALDHGLTARGARDWHEPERLRLRCAPGFARVRTFLALLAWSLAERRRRWRETR
jgi:hypothetical protein